MLSTGVIGVPLPLDRVLAGARAAVAELSPDGRRGRRSRDPDDGLGPEGRGRAAGGFTVGGMAKGAGMIHPRLATMLVVITTDYPLGRGRRRRSCVPPSRPASTGSRSTATAPRTTPSCCSRTARAAPRGTTSAFAEALGDVCGNLARQIVADGEGATVVLEIGVTGAATEGEAEAIARRIATSPLVKTAAFGHDPNWGRVLMAAGSAPYGDGYARLDTDRLSVSFDGVEVFSLGSPTGTVPELVGRGLPHRPRPRPRRRSVRLPRVRPHLRLRPDQRGVHDVSRIVLKLGGRVASEAAAQALALAADGHEVVVVHGAGPQITAEMAAARDRTRFRGRAARDDPRGARGRAELTRRGERRGLRRDRAERRSRSSATRSGSARLRSRPSGSSATRRPRPRRRSRRRWRRAAFPSSLRLRPAPATARR